MKVKNIISCKPHYGINIEKNRGFFDSKSEMPYQMNIFYLEERNEVEELDTIEEVCDYIRSKGYQVSIRNWIGNIDLTDIRYIIENKGIKDPIEKREWGPITYDHNFMPCRRYVEFWVHENSFIRKDIRIRITNKITTTSIEKEYSDGRTLERTRHPLDYQLITTHKEKECSVNIDEDIEDDLLRCKDILEADKIEITGNDTYKEAIITKFIKI